MTDKSNGQSNRLINETSPYLLQHAHNPVDWYAWGDEALKRARREDLPVLLSIGYSACHWCHVMERESFENDEIAQIMNRHFVCIKVDREERPDLDKVYQTAHQLFNQRGGGWPLTAILTPDELIPIHVGTYYPPRSRQGMPGFGDLLQRISSIYREQTGSLPDHIAAVKRAFAQLKTVQASQEMPIDGGLMQRAVNILMNEYDPVFGGFGAAPKFPHPTQLEMLLVYWNRVEHADQYSQSRSIDMTVHTLEAMANGGMYDQVGGGFCRYSVDAQWEIPHFEKMLYDTAQLMPIYVDAGFLSERNDLHHVAVQSGEWVMREMQSPDGGYFSAIDADSEGEEGKFYVWSLEEMSQLLAQDEFDTATIRFGLRGAPNFEGKWHLRIANSLETVAQRSGSDTKEVSQKLEQAREKLFEARSKRIAPLTDDKILASWNGMMIKAMARTGRYLDRRDFVESAERALNFIRERMWQNNRLFATSRGEKAHLNAYLDDYAFVADAAIELLHARWDDEDLRFAEELMNVLLSQFLDHDTGALFFTSDDHESLLYRAVPTHDEATPSGNGVAAQVLLKLSHLTGEQRYHDAAMRIIQALQASALNMPSAFGSNLIAGEEILNPNPTLMIVGDRPEVDVWAKACSASASQTLNLYPIPLDAERFPPYLPRQRGESNGIAAYLCEGFACSAPCNSLEELLTKLPSRKLRTTRP